MRPLPDLDLARIAPMTPERKRNALNTLKLGHPPYSYEPLRRTILDVLNIQAGPLASVPRTPWSAIASEVRRRSRKPDEFKANIAVAEALYGYASEHDISGIRHEIYPMNIGVSEKVVYWTPAVVSIDGRPVVPFIDPRRSAKQLTSAARLFVFSVMHERIRVADPDFADVGLCIIQFGCEDNRRIPIHYSADGLTLIPFDGLDQMVRETYAIWQEVLEEREANIRRRSSGTHGPLI